MPKITRDQVRVPADVMPESREEYIDNYLKATRGTGRLMLFACDQKIEHLNKDFYGEGIDLADAEPELAQVADAVGGLAALARLVQRRQQHRSEDRDDRDDDQELDQGKVFSHHEILSVNGQRMKRPVS